MGVVGLEIVVEVVVIVVVLVWVWWFILSLYVVGVFFVFGGKFGSVEG